MGTTPGLKLRYPELTDTADGPTAFSNLGVDVENYVLNRALPSGVTHYPRHHWGSATAFPTTGVLAGDSVIRTDLGNSLWTYDGAGWRTTPGAVSGKMWLTAGFSGSLTANTMYTVAYNVARVSGGVTFTAAANTLTLPIDGFYTLRSRTYATAGPPPYDCKFYVNRTRSGGTATIMTNVFYKESGEDRMPVFEDALPMKAGDTVWSQCQFSASGANYWGNSEINGVTLYAEWAGPLNGATPV